MTRCVEARSSGQVWWPGVVARRGGQVWPGVARSTVDMAIPQRPLLLPTQLLAGPCVAGQSHAL